MGRKGKAKKQQQQQGQGQGQEQEQPLQKKQQEEEEVATVSTSSAWLSDGALSKLLTVNTFILLLALGMRLMSWFNDHSNRPYSS